MHEWVNLTPVDGDTVSSPSKTQLAKALRQLFSSRDDEHPDSWIVCGSTDGPLYSISIFSCGFALYTKYSDADMTNELENLKLPNIDQEAALTLWENLIAGSEPDPDQLLSNRNSAINGDSRRPWWKIW